MVEGCGCLHLLLASWCRKGRGGLWYVDDISEIDDSRFEYMLFAAYLLGSMLLVIRASMSHHQQSQLTIMRMRMGSVLQYCTVQYVFLCNFTSKGGLPDIRVLN